MQVIIRTLSVAIITTSLLLLCAVAAEDFSQWSAKADDRMVELHTRGFELKGSKSELRSEGWRYYRMGWDGLLRGCYYDVSYGINYAQLYMHHGDVSGKYLFPWLLDTVAPQPTQEHKRNPHCGLG